MVTAVLDASGQPPCMKHTHMGGVQKGEADRVANTQFPTLQSTVNCTFLRLRAANTNEQGKKWTQKQVMVVGLHNVRRTSSNGRAFKEILLNTDTIQHLQ